MNYFLNEYSMRGQFKDVDDFFESLRIYTLPALKKIEEQAGNLIWKKDTFWQLEICNGIILSRIPRKKNERSAEWVSLQNKLSKLINEDPFWYGDCKCNLEIKEYKFDEDYRESFGEPTCFAVAIENEGRIISFIHPNYNIRKLPMSVAVGGIDREYSLDNIYDDSWWEHEPQITTWRALEKYTVQVRAKEFDFHPPHFHVICNEFEAVFKLSNGELYKYGRKRWTTQMIAEIQEWYRNNKEELQKAWNLLHLN